MAAPTTPATAAREGETELRMPPPVARALTSAERGQDEAGAADADSDAVHLPDRAVEGFDEDLVRAELAQREGQLPKEDGPE